MFDDLDSTIKKILGDALAPQTVANADVSFLTPDKNFAPAQATIDLFLYDVKENRELRDPTPIVQRQGTTFVRKAPPIRIDCSYIVTTWSTKAGDAKITEEHGLLAQTLMWLSRFPVIPANYLQGSLANPIYPAPLMVAQLDPNTNAGEFWDALSIPPRPAFYLTATIAMDLGVADQGFLVRTHFSKVSPPASGPDVWVQIAGLVLNKNTGTGVANALVDVIDAGLRTNSDEAGRYSFLRVPTGNRTLRVVATGFAPQTQPLTVPDLPDTYDVRLTPL